MYGIRIYEKDNTPGHRCSDTWEKWYNSEEERDEKYASYTSKFVRYKDLALPDSYVVHTYTKIEK